MKPVIFIDEFGALEELYRKDPDAFVLFLDWLLKISKDSKYAHIVMASHNAFFMKILQEIYEPNYLKQIHLKDLS
jgi:hypothetical protein